MEYLQVVCQSFVNIPFIFWKTDGNTISDVIEQQWRISKKNVIKKVLYV